MWGFIRVRLKKVSYWVDNGSSLEFFFYIIVSLIIHICAHIFSIYCYVSVYIVMNTYFLFVIAYLYTLFGERNKFMNENPIHIIKYLFILNQ